jgi:TATA-box binding protein (TBP) (component of TFIID and TFIIIB)
MSKYTKTDLRISTMVITAHWGVQINLDMLFNQLRSIIIPIWYPNEGILKFEHRNMVVGSSHKDIFTNRKITSKSFFNQSTLVLRRKIVENGEDKGWKEVNVKLFANGGIQMTGVTSLEFARNAIEWLLDIIKGLSDSPFNGDASIQRFSVQLINTDYAINKFINQDALHKILINDYNLFSMLEKTIYQGVNTKFFYNSRNPEKGICECETFCKGQGDGNGEGQCKRITMSIFRTGRIIITGARELEQIRSAYTFLNSVFDKYADRVLYEPNTNTVPVKSKSTTKTTDVSVRNNIIGEL